MTFRKQLAVLLLLVPARVLADDAFQTDPAYQLDPLPAAEVALEKNVASEKRMSETLAQQDLRRRLAAERKVSAQLAAALAPMLLPPSSHGASRTGKTHGSDSALYAVK